MIPRNKVAVILRDAGADQDLVLEDQECTIPLDGSEIFFTPPAHDLPVYDVRVSGVFNFKKAFLEAWGWPKQGKGDPLYHTGMEGPRCTEPHERLLFNNRPLVSWQHKMIAKDRGAHSYHFLLHGPSREPLSISFDRSGLRVRGTMIARITEVHRTPKPPRPKITPVTPVPLALAEVRPAAEEPKLRTVPQKPAALTPEENRECKLRAQDIALNDKLELAFHRVAIEQKIRVRVEVDYVHLSEDERQRMVHEILEQVMEEEELKGRTL